MNGNDRNTLVTKTARRVSEYGRDRELKKAKDQDRDRDRGSDNVTTSNNKERNNRERNISPIMSLAQIKIYSSFPTSLNQMSCYY